MERVELSVAWSRTRNVSHYTTSRFCKTVACIASNQKLIKVERVELSVFWLQTSDVDRYTTPCFSVFYLILVQGFEPRPNTFKECCPTFRPHQNFVKLAA